MDILNNIWTAISTPNDFIINTFLVFAIFLLEIPLVFSVICNIFNLKPTQKQRIIYILVNSSTSIFNFFVIPSPYNSLINYIVIFITLYILFKPSILKGFIMTFIPTMVFTLVELLILNPFLNICNITYETLNNIPIFRISFVLLAYFIIFIINQFFKIKNLKLHILDNLDYKNKHLIIINLLLGFLTIIIQFILITIYINEISLFFSLLNFICLLVYFTLSIHSLTRVMKLVTTTQKLESAEAYNKTLHILHDSVRGFKHDFDNIVTTIGGYIQTNDMKGLEKYYSQLQYDCAKVNNLYVLNPDIINNPGIYNLLTTKYNEAEEKDIKVTLTFLLDLNKINMKIYEFARILGILLDNSIEAASECDNKILNITFRNDAKNNRNLIIIENTYKDKHVNLENIFNKGISGKQNHTGLGLWEVRQILNKNNNVNLHTSKNEEYFIQQLEIYY